MNTDELTLVKEAKNGSLRALEKLIKLEQNNIYTTLYCLKKDNYELYDIMQNILIKIARKLPTLKKPELFKSWLNKIIINSYYDYIRKYKPETNTKSLNETNFEIADSKYNPLDNILYTELELIVKKTIGNLPIHYKIPITLREIQGLSYENISEITGITIGTIKSRIARARGIIKDEIKKYSF